MMIVFEGLLLMAFFFILIIKIIDKCMKAYDEVMFGQKYQDFGCNEDFSSRNEYDEKDPWSMFRETK